MFDSSLSFHFNSFLLYLFGSSSSWFETVFLYFLVAGSLSHQHFLRFFVRSRLWERNNFLDKNWLRFGNFMRFRSYRFRNLFNHWNNFWRNDCWDLVLFFINHNNLELFSCNGLLPFLFQCLHGVWEKRNVINGMPHRIGLSFDSEV